DVSAGHEIELLAVLVEGSRTSITEPVSYLARFCFLKRIDENRAVPRLKRFGVGDPAAIRRPTGVEAKAASGGVNFDRRPLIDIHVLQVEPLVGVGNLFTVR